MGLSKYNAEGYYDPTAYEGIRQADVDSRKPKIPYPTGYMELNLDYSVQMQDYADKASSNPAKSDEYGEYISRSMKTRRLRQRIATNIELFTAGRDKR